MLLSYNLNIKLIIINLLAVFTKHVLVLCIYFTVKTFQNHWVQLDSSAYGNFFFKTLWRYQTDMYENTEVLYLSEKIVALFEIQYIKNLGE